MAGGNNLKDNSTESVTQVAITKRPSNGKEKYAYRQYDSIGKDVVWYVSGSIDGATPENKAVAVFGGDVVVSGSLKVEGGELAGSFNFDVDVFELTGSIHVEGPGSFTGGISGSITSLVDGTPYIIASYGISISTGSKGEIIVAAAETLEWNERVGYGDGFATVFNLTHIPTQPTSLMLFVNGVLQERDEETADFHLEGSTITFNYVPPLGSKITATYSRR
jgi:hypothetical protein